MKSRYRVTMPLPVQTALNGTQWKNVWNCGCDKVEKSQEQMRATKMTSSHCRSATPPLSRASSTDLVTCPMSPDLARHRALSPDLTLDFTRHRPLSPDVLERCRPLSPDFQRRSRSPARPRSLMESLLVAKMEALSTGKLVRTDSMDSCSSFGSMSSLPSDVCRCDDCLLGIVDFYMPSPEEANKVLRKVCFI